MKSFTTFVMSFVLGGLFVYMLAAPSLCTRHSLPVSENFEGVLIDQTSCYKAEGMVLCCAGSNDLGLKYVDSEGNVFYLIENEINGADIVGTFCPESEYLKTAITEEEYLDSVHYGGPSIKED